MKKLLLIIVLVLNLFAKEDSRLTYGLGMGFISTPSYIG